jgi:hypothetical protein
MLDHRPCDEQRLVRMGRWARVLQSRCTLRRDDEAEVVPVLLAPRAECRVVSLVGVTIEHRWGLVVPLRQTIAPATAAMRFSSGTPAGR